jgi:hypothetical protein
VPDASGLNALTIGGITTLWDNATYVVNFGLSPDYNLIIQGGLAQTSPSEVLEQQLRNSTWQGTYDIGYNHFSTTLTLVVVQNGYVGGEIIHSEPQRGGYLHCRVTGDIVTQYQVDDTFMDEDRLSPEELANLSLDTPNRQLIRIKRVRALEFNDNAGDGWNANREYRVILQDNMLVGSVGIPNDGYGQGDATSSNGNLSLTLVK